MRSKAATQGCQADPPRHPLRHGDGEQPALFRLPLPNAGRGDGQPADDRAGRAHDTRGGLYAGPVRRGDGLRSGRGPARRGLPLGRTLHATRVREQVHRIAARLDAELGPEDAAGFSVCARDLEALPVPDLPLVVGLDGGYVHSSAQTCRSDGWCEVIAGKSISHQPGPGGEVLRVRTDHRDQAEAAPARGPRCPGRAGQPVGGLPHRRRRGRPRPAAVPVSALRALAGLVPPHHAADRLDEPWPSPWPRCPRSRTSPTGIGAGLQRTQVAAVARKYLPRRPGPFRSRPLPRYRR